MQNSQLYKKVDLKNIYIDKKFRFNIFLNLNFFTFHLLYNEEVITCI